MFRPFINHAIQCRIYVRSQHLRMSTVVPAHLEPRSSCTEASDFDSSVLAGVATEAKNLSTLSHEIAALKRTQSSHRTTLKIRFQTDLNKLTSELRQLKTFHEKHAPHLEDLGEIRAYVSQAEREKERK